MSNSTSLVKSSVINANNEFVKDVYWYLAANHIHNSIISPCSLHVALGLTLCGAAGTTAEALVNGLRLQNQAEVKNYKAIINQLDKCPEVKIANKIYFAADVELNPAFEKEAVDYFNTGLDKVDFHQSVPAANQINDWVAGHTNGKIKDFIKPVSLTSDTSLLLINAVYFKGKWATPFDPQHTKEGLFHENEHTSVHTHLMHVEDSFFMYEEEEDDGFKMLELPYGSKENSQFSMFIFLPNKRNGLAALEKRLFQTQGNSTMFRDFIENGYKTDVKVTLPRFKVENSWHMKHLLSVNMGMEIAFLDGADFSAMTKDKVPLKISDVIQKAVIEVNEEGTEAAAATEVQMIMTSSGSDEPPPEPRVFKADHPFGYCITYSPEKNVSPEDRLILFVGTVHSVAKDKAKFSMMGLFDKVRRGS